MSDDDPAPLYPSDPPDGSTLAEWAELGRLLADLGKALADLGKALGGAAVRHLPRRP